MNFYEGLGPDCPKCHRVMDPKDRLEGYYFCQYCEIIWDAKNPGKELDDFPERKLR